MIEHFVGVHHTLIKHRKKEHKTDDFQLETSEKQRFEWLEEFVHCWTRQNLKKILQEFGRSSDRTEKVCSFSFLLNTASSSSSSR